MFLQLIYPFFIFIYLFIYFICPFLYLFIHFSSSVFIGVSDQQEARGRYRILKEKKKIKEDLNGYHHWLNTGCKCLIKGCDKLLTTPTFIVSEEDDSTRTTRSRSLQRNLKDT